jgi:DNA-binding response OmpR family regulator
MSARKILVIEDEAGLRANVARFLKAEGYEVLTAENGASGVDIAVKQMPDLIVCDIAMPEMDGFGVLFSLRENVTTSNIPFIFLTASTRTYDRNWGVELGANDYITKPFKLEQLLGAIRKRLPG